MCEYCQHVSGDDYDVQDLMQIPVITGIGSFIKSAGDAYHDEIDICIENDELHVDVWLGGDCKCVAKLPIKYCPVCGQDLKYLIEKRKNNEG